jgi:hypothetical protein
MSLVPSVSPRLIQRSRQVTVGKSAQDFFEHVTKM